MPCAINCSCSTSHSWSSVLCDITIPAIAKTKEILLKVIEPLKVHYPEEMWDKVIKSFSLIYGSEVFLVMKDIWKMDDQQVIDMTQWSLSLIPIEVLFAVLPSGN